MEQRHVWSRRGSGRLLPGTFKKGLRTFNLPRLSIPPSQVVVVVVAGGGGAGNMLNSAPQSKIVSAKTFGGSKLICIHVLNPKGSKYIGTY